MDTQMARAKGAEEQIVVALVIGDTRLAGTILSGLLHNSSIELHQVVLPNNSASLNASIRIHETDFTLQALSVLFQRVHPDIIFSAHSSGSYDVQKRIIDSSIAAGVPRFVPAEFSQDCLNEEVRRRLPPCRGRARVIEYLRGRATEGHISWAAVATGTELGHGLISGNLGFEMKWHSATVFGTGKERFAASSATWIGKVALKMVQRWGEVTNRFLYAAETVVSACQIAQALENETGSQWEIGYVGLEDGIREAERRMERGFPDAGMFLMERSVLSDPAVDALRPFVEDDGKERLNLTGGSLEKVVKEIVHDYEHHEKGDCRCE